MQYAPKCKQFSNASCMQCIQPSNQHIDYFTYIFLILCSIVIYNVSCDNDALEQNANIMPRAVFSISCCPRPVVETASGNFSKPFYSSQIQLAVFRITVSFFCCSLYATAVWGKKCCHVELSQCQKVAPSRASCYRCLSIFFVSFCYILRCALFLALYFSPSLSISSFLYLLCSYCPCRDIPLIVLFVFCCWLMLLCVFVRSCGPRA